MQCPKCNSHNVHRSLRRGLYQGVLQRLMLRAPFRCSNCGHRFSASSLGNHFRKRRHHSLAGWLGIRTKDRRRIGRRIAVGSFTLILIVLAIWIVFFLAEPRVPVQSVPRP